MGGRLSLKSQYRQLFVCIINSKCIFTGIKLMSAIRQEGLAMPVDQGINKYYNK